VFHSWIIAKRLAAGPTPLDLKDIQRLAGQGVRTIITLTEQPLTRFDDITPAALARLDVRLTHHGFADASAPSSEQAHAILGELHSALKMNMPVYLHCFGGSGRTGTILHLLLLSAGLPLIATRRLIKQRRPQCLRLTEEQHAFVQSWAINYLHTG
jgi:protein-tyrosine phosphatase